MRDIIYFGEKIYFEGYSAVGGFEEGRGTIGEKFDFISEDDLFGMKSFERAESEMCRIAMNIALKKCNITNDELSVLVAGDLQNQCVGSTSGLFSFGVPYLGLYGACSTLTESLGVCASIMNVGASYKRGAVVTSSHNCTSERQFRNPLEYGGQRAPSTQWTATAAGAFILEKREANEKDDAPFISAFMPGRVIDGYTKDAANMGGAMALSSFDTMSRFFSPESGERVEDYDLILTGDLGKIGSDILSELLVEKLGKIGEKIKERHNDAGLILYDREKQDVHAGGSGCGCSASVMGADILKKVKRGEIKKMLLMSTGALMNSTSVLQGEHIFGITPCIKIESSVL